MTGPYERLIELKERMKEEKERAMKMLLRELERIERESSKTETKILESQGLILEGLDGNDFSVLSDYLSFLERHRLELERQKRERQAMVDAIRAELLDLVKEIKMLKGLESKRENAQKRAREKRIQKRLDEISVRKKKDL
jgi:flagellar biosynthesis chaperone FliJ